MISSELGRVAYGLKCSVQNRKFPCSTLLDARLGFGTQHFYEAPGDLWVEINKT